MTEHILRYDPFCPLPLAEQGIAVIGHDHLGHGGTVQDGTGMVTFADQAGHVCVIRDLHRQPAASGSCIRAPAVYAGTQHGSFFLRRYLTLYGEDWQERF